ncbi:MAG: DUF4956 domain-containing protein [Bacteroidetes bacterium]|nr:DUF4956 domain-containing protein [Bacteroidota bacterium]
MKPFKSILVVFLFLYLALPVKVCIAQQSETELLQTDETTTVEAKPAKKKKVFELDEKFFISLAINMAAVALIISLIYYPNYRKLDYIFTFIMFNLIIFLLTFTLKYIKLSMGAVFGLFAVFSILRYRTAGISMKDMTYLFLFIAMGLISAIQLDYYELAILDAVIFGVAFCLDGNLLFRQELSKTIQYENIEMIKPENSELLIEDLKKRTGLDIHRIAISRIDFLKDSARVRIYYYAKRFGKNHRKIIN